MVTLARSVAHLSSEMRNLQVVIQEVEALRGEMQQGGGVRWVSHMKIHPLLRGGSVFSFNTFLYLLFMHDHDIYLYI